MHRMNLSSTDCSSENILPQFRYLYKRKVRRTRQEKAMRKEAAQVLYSMRRVHNNLRAIGRIMDAGMAAAMKQFVTFCKEEL